MGGLLISMSAFEADWNVDASSPPARAFTKTTDPARRRPAHPRLGAALPRRGRARRPEGRGGHGAEGYKILLLIDRRSFGHHHSTAGERGAPGAAGAEGRGNP